MKKRYAIGIDIGGTKIEMGLVDMHGLVSEKIRIPSNVTGGYHAMEKDIISSIETLKKTTNGRVFGIGAGIPGQVNTRDGSILLAPNLQWENIPFKTNIEQKTRLPIVLTNDVRAATWGEWLNGAGQGCHDLACVFVGTGIGGGIVNADRMIEGFSNCAGEIGHTIIQRHGPLCTCGNHGCFEALASGWAITKRTKEIIQDNHQKGNIILALADGKIQAINTKLIVQAYHQGDALAQEIFQDVFDALIIGCVGLVNTVNPEKLILGGGVVFGLPEIVERVREGIKKYSVRAATSSVEVIQAKFTQDAGTIGAGTLAWNTFTKTFTPP